MTKLDEIERQQNGMMPGYISFRELPNSIVLLPPAPEEGSMQDALDKELTEAILKESDSTRVAMAVKDAALSFPEAIQSFNEIVKLEINEVQTPQFYMLLQRVLTDAAMSTYLAKQQYKRQRPYAVNGKSSCVPEKEEHMQLDGSYPSGHAAIGWTWALIYTELFPEYTNHLLHRGKDFGQSRVVCNVHYQSDVDNGRTMGTAVYSRLHSDKNFLADLEQSKKELELLKKK